MINKIYKRIVYKLNGISNDQLSLQANIREGLKLGKNVYGIEGCTIDHGSCWLIEVGDNVVFAPQVYLLAHDTSSKKFVEYVKIGKIKIGDNCFIGARAFIMPGVEIGDNSIVGAGSLVTKSFPANVVIGGNPAKIICTLHEYQTKLNNDIQELPKFGKEYTLLGGVTEEMKNEMMNQIEKFGFVK